MSGLGSIIAAIINSRMSSNNEDASSQGMSNYGYWNNYVTPNQEYWQTPGGQPQSPFSLMSPNRYQPFNFGNMSLLDLLSSYRPYSQWGGFFK